MARALEEIATDAAGCTRCPLYARATQTVFGEGPERASLVLVGEQPGNEEDLQGHPFVGPAGAVLERALSESGIERSSVYVTNAVKHFKWEERGKRRLHKAPSRSEVVACQPWLVEELLRVRPAVVVALGATAGNSLFGPTFRVGTSRGRPLEASLGAWAGTVVATIHPSAVLRARDEPSRAALRRQLLEDLALALELCAAS